MELVVLPSRRDKKDISAGTALGFPYAPLLAVNSMIRAEAAYTFYDKNRWAISDKEREIALPPLFYSHVRHLSIRYDCDVVDPAEMGRISQDLFTGQNASLTDVVRTAAIHKSRKRHLVKI